MHRLLSLSALLVLTGIVVGVVSFTRAESDEKVAEEYQKIEKGFLEKIEDAGDDERPKLLDSYAKKFLAHAKRNPKDETALPALVYVLRMTRPSKDKESTAFQAWEIITRDHAKHPKVVDYLEVFTTRGDDGVTFLKTVASQHPERKTQGKALLAIVKSRETILNNAKLLKDNKDFREQVTKKRGEEFVKEVLDKAAAYEKESAELKKQLEKYSDVVVNLAIGQPAPPVTSQDLEGKKVQLADHKGKVVVIDIWATWCGPCRAMIPHTRELVKKMDGKPFTFISVSADDNKEKVKTFMEKTPMPWTHWWNGPKGGIVADWDVEYYPTIYVLDHKGVIRHKDLRDKDLDAAVEKLVEEAEKDKKK